MLAAVAFLAVSIIEVESASVSVGIPADAINFGVKKIDDFFSCSRYDGYAACFHRGGGKDRRDREASHCGHANIWDYKHTIGGQCWCFKCT